MVDSGAHGTLLPKSIAHNLGLDPNTDLQQTPDGSGGAGGTSFPTWTATQPITGQVVAMLPSGPTLWGPIIDLQPRFADGEPALLGRLDFFKHFTITFANHAANGPVFHLDH